MHALPCALPPFFFGDSPMLASNSFCCWGLPAPPSNNLQVLRFQASKHHAHLLRILYQSEWPAAAYLSQVSQDLVILILGCQFAISSSFCSVAYIPLQDSRVDKYNYRLCAAGNNERYLSFKFTKHQGCFKWGWENKSKDLTLCVFKIILKMLKALQESW